MVQVRRFALPLLLAAGFTVDASAQTAASPPAAGGAPEAAGPAGGASANIPQPATGTSAVVLDMSAVDGVIGKGVKSFSGEDMGQIVDLLVTPAGQVRAAIIQFGGVLGVGNRKVAIDWAALDFKTSAKGGDAVLRLTRDQVRVSPEYKPGDPVVVLETTTGNAAPLGPPRPVAPAQSSPQNPPIHTHGATP